SHDMKKINEEFYELIAQDKLPSDNNPYEVDWSKYDSLAPREEHSCNEGNLRFAQKRAPLV
ncbi:hypothetical protein, partial [Heyndrickxia coagulans]